MIRGRKTTAAVGFTTLLHQRRFAADWRFCAPSTSDVALAQRSRWPAESRRESGEGDVG